VVTQEEEEMSKAKRKKDPLNEIRYTLATAVPGVNDKPVIDPYENARLRSDNEKLRVEVECMRRLIVDALKGGK
jgi:hypothetical protein